MVTGSATSTAGYFQTGCPFCSPSTASSNDREDRDTARARSTTSDRAPNELSAEEKKQVDELKKRDREVKAHEAAHMAAAGGYVRGGASYSYQAGPDGRRYAVGGEVSIDTSAEDDPNATIRKMQAVRSAALAPADPSGQDRSVAASAAAQEARARQQLQAGKKSATDGSGKIGEKNVHRPVIYTAEGKSTAVTGSKDLDLTV